MELWSAEKVLVKGRFEKDWGVAVDTDGMVQAVGPRSHLVASARRVSHHPDKILLPAFINPHHQGFDRLFRSLTDLDLSYRDLLRMAIWPLSGSVNRDLFDAVYRVALAEQALSGVATVGEFHYLHNGCYENGEAGFAERLIRVATDMGMRLSLVYTFFDQGSSELTKPFIQPMDLSQKTYEDLQDRYGSHPLINLIPGIHSLEHTSPDAIIAAANLAEKYDTPFHVRLAAREDDLEISSVHYDATPLKALEKMGVLNERLVVIHGTHLNDEELGLMEKHGVTVILSPTANLAKGDRRPNTSGLLKNKIPFAVSSGGLPLFNGYSAPEEIKWLELNQREDSDKRDLLCSNMDIESLWELGTRLPSQALGVNSSRFMPGSAADFMLISQSQPCTKPAFDDGSRLSAMNELLFGWGSNVQVTHLYVQGKMVVGNGQFGIDLSQSYRMLERTCAAYMENIQKKTAAN